MQRPIRFRVWSNDSKKMYNVISLDHPTEDGFDSIGIHDENADVDTWLEGKEYELMQYTGMEDIDGKEIWEGDIVQFVHGGIQGRVMEVKIPDCYYDDDEGIYAQQNWQVLGNIYENSNILGEAS